MRRVVFVLATLVMASLAVTSCQNQAVMWAACAPAADGSPWGTDGTYVLACDGGTWKPVMTTDEYFRISAGQDVTIAPLPSPPATTPGGGAPVPTTPAPTVPTTPPGVRAVDQSADGPSTGDALMTCPTEWTRAQTFTAGRTGTLDGVSLRSAGTMAASVSVRTVAADGTPSPTQIGSGSRTGSSSQPWTEISLSSPAAVQAGVTYALVVTSSRGCGGDWSIAVNADAYPAGTSWYQVPEAPGVWNRSGEDLTFRTWVR
ncbi:MAG TPA: hypothetical protein PKE05_05760 [Microthrixaceae bacterium]|nr:hypothetical protein [Microthrixaceae bacterium]